MPQLDFSFYLSQICWLLVSFGTFFFVSRFLILPRLQKILSNRENLIQGNLNYADKMLAEAKKIEENYQKKISQKEDEVEAEVARLIATLSQDNQNAIENLKKQLTAEAGQANIAVRKSITDMKSQINNYIVEIVGEIMNNVYKISFDKKKIEEICKKNFSSVLGD